MDKEETAAPFPMGERGDEMVVVANVYPVTGRNETEVMKVEKQFQVQTHLSRMN